MHVCVAHFYALFCIGKGHDSKEASPASQLFQWFDRHVISYPAAECRVRAWAGQAVG